MVTGQEYKSHPQALKDEECHICKLRIPRGSKHLLVQVREWGGVYSQRAHIQCDRLANHCYKMADKREPIFPPSPEKEISESLVEMTPKKLAQVLLLVPDDVRKYWKERREKALNGV